MVGLIAGFVVVDDDTGDEQIQIGLLLRKNTRNLVGEVDRERRFGHDDGVDRLEFRLRCFHQIEQELGKIPFRCGSHPGGGIESERRACSGLQEVCRRPS